MARMRLSTVWLLTQQGRELSGMTDAEEAWTAKNATPRFSDARVFWFNPVEINIDPADVPAAVAKWERIAEISGVCHVETHERRLGETKNVLYP